MFARPTNAQLSGRAPDRDSIHPSIVLTSHLLLRQGRGNGTWFRGHAPHLKDRGNACGNTCYSSASWNRCLVSGWKARECRIQRRRKGRAGRQMLRVIIKQIEMIKLSTLTMCCLVGLNYTSVKLVEKRKESRELATPLPPQKCTAGQALGMQVLMRKFN